MGSSKSTLVSAPATISADIKKWAGWMIIGFAIVFALSYIISTVRKDYKQRQSEREASVHAQVQPTIPLASWSLDKWTKAVLPPKIGGRVDIPVHPGYRPMVSGDNNFVVHTVYSGKSECARASEGKGSDTVCPVGAVGVYVTNRMAKENPISFAYEPI